MIIGQVLRRVGIAAGITDIEGLMHEQADVTLDRPQRLNAWTPRMSAELAHLYPFAIALSAGLILLAYAIARVLGIV